MLLITGFPLLQDHLHGQCSLCAFISSLTAHLSRPSQSPYPSHTLMLSHLLPLPSRGQFQRRHQGTGQASPPPPHRPLVTLRAFRFTLLGGTCLSIFPSLSLLQGPVSPHTSPKKMSLPHSLAKSAVTLSYLYSNSSAHLPSYSFIHSFHYSLSFMPSPHTDMSVSHRFPPWLCSPLPSQILTSGPQNSIPETEAGHHLPMESTHSPIPHGIAAVREKSLAQLCLSRNSSTSCLARLPADDGIREAA